MTERFSILTILGGSKERWHVAVDTMFEMMSADVQGHEADVTNEDAADFILLIGTLTNTNQETLEKELDEETTRYKDMVANGKRVFRDFEQADEAIKAEIEENE